MKRIVLCFCLVMQYLYSQSQQVFEFTGTCQQAYHDITKLKINSGLTLVQKAKEENPNNLIPLLLESYADFYVLLLNESPKDYKERYPKFQKRLEAIQQGSDDSPFYNYSLGTIRMLRAAVSAKFGKLWDAGWDFKRADQLFRENRKRFPNFTPNDLMYGTLQTVAGTIPDGYKWIAGLLGMRGSITEGMKMVRGFIHSNDPWAKFFFNEATFVYAYLMFYFENKKEMALEFIQQQKLDLVNNHLHTYMAANLSLHNKQSKLSESIILKRNLSNEYLKTTVWDFELGFAKLYRLDTQGAIRHFESFLSGFAGNFYVKNILQKLSWAYYLQGNMVKAEEMRKRILQKGSTESDADKQALKDAQTGKWPNQLLLKARLLNDGGFASEAAALLHGKTEDDFAKEEDKLEFAYRAARIYDDLERGDEAIIAYLIAMRLGQDRREHYAARAALQVGYIYEKRGHKQLAIRYFQRCLDMEDHEYKNSIDQRAKSGIARCKGE